MMKKESKAYDDKLGRFYDSLIERRMKLYREQAIEASKPLIQRKWFKRYFIKLPIICFILTVVVMIVAAAVAFYQQNQNLLGG